MYDTNLFVCIMFMTCIAAAEESEEDEIEAPTTSSTTPKRPMSEKAKKSFVCDVCQKSFGHKSKFTSLPFKMVADLTEKKSLNIL